MKSESWKGWLVAGWLGFAVLLAVLPVCAQGWDWEVWWQQHEGERPTFRTSQSGRADLEPLLVNSRGEPIRDQNAWELKRLEMLTAVQSFLGLPLGSGQTMVYRVLEEKQEDGYRRLRLVFEGEPDELIPAFLLLPTGLQRPAPAVICLHQTNGLLGKREPCGLEGERELAFALELVRRGYATLASDAICFGERYQAGKPWKHYGDAPGFYQSHPNWSIMGKMVWDISRAVDLLQVLPEVDRNRIGVIGHSHGGYSALFALLFEPRLRVGVASCAFTPFRGDPSFERWYRSTALLPRLGFFEGEVDDLPFDFHHVLGGIAPTPLFYAGALQDSIFPTTGDLPWIMDQVGRVYRLYDAGDRFAVRLYEGDHRFPTEVREEAYAFLDRFLK